MLWTTKLTAILLLLLSFAAGTQAGESVSPFDIQKDITDLLLKRDLTELAEEAAQKPASNVVPLARQIAIFDRAGQGARANSAARKLLDAPDRDEHLYLARNVFGAHLAETDLAGWRTYYELGNLPHPDNHNYPDLSKLLKLWEDADSKPSQIEAWLRERHAASDSAHKDNWFNVLFEWLETHGGADELRGQLRSEFAANPKDVELAVRYLNSVKDVESAAFVAATFASPYAHDYYVLGERLHSCGRWQTSAGDGSVCIRALQLAVNFYQKSLELPFTEYDRNLVGSTILAPVVIRPLNYNYEKQLRVWTKQRLAETFVNLRQPQLAQPLVEELTAVDKSDIIDRDDHRLAGATQMASGQRVVESKLLKEEATKRDFAEYWLERVRYYEGRREPALVRQTYAAAFAALSYKPGDTANNHERAMIVDAFVFDLTNDADCDEDDKSEANAVRCREAEKFLRDELTVAANDGAYGYLMVETTGGGDRRRLRETLFAERPNLLIKVLAPLQIWDYELIETVAENKKITAAQKQQLWRQLETLADNSSLLRQKNFAGAMFQIEENDKAIRLLTKLLPQIPKTEDECYGVFNSDCEDVLSDVNDTLFFARLGNGEWRTAEKMLSDNGLSRWSDLPENIEKIAITAAKRGDTADALRLWKRRANIDRRQLDGLTDMAKTKAKEPLRQFYQTLKRRDPQSVVPDAALAKLQ